MIGPGPRRGRGRAGGPGRLSATAARRCRAPCARPFGLTRRVTVSGFGADNYNRAKTVVSPAAFKSRYVGPSLAGPQGRRTLMPENLLKT
eukprot:748328-Hanusia_phi.AAC.3